MQDKVWSDFCSLPPEAQRQAAEFIAFLRQRHGHAARQTRPAGDWDSEPFVGMWRDREDMRDGGEWVRHTRRKEWTEPDG